MPESKDILIGIDAGTSVIKAVAFDLRGSQVAVASVPNRYQMGVDGSACQSLDQTWSDCAQALRLLGDKVINLASRTMALAVTAQGDGTWLVGENDRPVDDAWLWLDARAAPVVQRLRTGPAERIRFEKTGTGLNTCQQGVQLAHMAVAAPVLLKRAQVAFHCKDWLYLCMTGVRATDPSEASFTFGDFRTRQYDATVIDALGLTSYRHLLPEIVDGTQLTHPLSARAAKETGLLAGTPVSLGFVDMVMTALGAGVYTGEADVACSTVGSTGVHMRAVKTEDVVLNEAGTGYVIALPAPGMVTQMQTNMAATLNIDWALRLAADLANGFDRPLQPEDLMCRIEDWLSSSQPGALLYHPYISDAGERGPFINSNAQAAFIGLSSHHRFADLLRAVVEGLGMAMRDCYGAMGSMPTEVRLTGGAARSPMLRSVLGASIGAPVRMSSREEAGAAGAAMMAAVATGVYPTMDDCISAWVTPLLSGPEVPEPSLIRTYNRLFENYTGARSALEPVWDAIASSRAEKPKHP